VRLVLEEAGAEYADVARERGSQAVMDFLRGSQRGPPVFAPPVLVHGDAVIAQTAAICHYLGRRHDLAPGDEVGDAQALEVQLTIADLVVEVHDTHHPISSSLYYEDQRSEALRRAQHFVGERLPRFVRYFERAIERNGGGCWWGAASRMPICRCSRRSRGLGYAFPRAFARATAETPRVIALRERVRERRASRPISRRAGACRSISRASSGTTPSSTRNQGSAIA
jgi:glutathione S-transferase